MEQALQQLGFQRMDEVSTETLKRAFKRAAVESHPDKGGSEGDFDNVLAAYLYLSNILKRTTGGRGGFQVIDPSEVRQAREDQFVSELNNMVSEIFDQVDATKNETFLKEFNEQFEKNHVFENEVGYEAWFRSHEDDIKEEPVQADDPFEWNRSFESRVKLGKPEPTALILHPDQMAFVSGSTRGSALIQGTGHSFTSDVEANPEYTDLHDAYTAENTVYDKIPVYQERERTFESLLKERDLVYTTELDRDLEAIAAYEKQKQEEEKEHKLRVEEYFKNTASSVWALRGGRSDQGGRSVESDPSILSVQNEQPLEKDSFVKEI
jgi:curved DNA-binding protein CbpA